MKLRDNFIIYFSSLTEGKNQFEYKIDDTFFKKIEKELEFSSSVFDLFLEVDKKASFVEFSFKIIGKLTLDCDISLESFDFNIDCKHKLIIKFGEEYNNDNEDIIELPRNKNDFDISQTIYEIVILAVPNKKIHPKLLSGELKSDVLEKLERYMVNEINVTEENGNVEDY